MVISPVVSTSVMSKEVSGYERSKFSVYECDDSHDLVLKVVFDL